MIIITDAHYRSCVSMMEALAKSGEDIILCADEGTDPPAFHSKYCLMARYMPKDDEAYKDELYELCRLAYNPDTDEKCVVIPIGLRTVTLLSEHKEEFSKIADFIVPDKDVLKKANDKKAIAEEAKAIGIRTPKEIETDEFGYPLSEFVRYPLYVKPVFGEHFGLRANERYDIVFDDDELSASYLKFLELTEEAPVIQEYAGDTGMGVCVVMDNDSNPVSIFCHKRIREYPVSGGPSSCCVSVYSENLVKRSVELLQSINYTGIAMVEFRGSEGAPFSLLEINTRIWGSFPLCVKSGSTFIQDYVLAARKVSFASPNTSYKRGKMMTFAVNDVLAGIDYIRSGSTALGLHAIASAIDPSVSEGVFNMEDPKPFFVYLNNCRKKILSGYSCNKEAFTDKEKEDCEDREEHDESEEK